VMFGLMPDGTEIAASMDLVRLAIPRRTYTQSHADYIIEVFEELSKNKNKLTGYKIIYQPKMLRHFTCKFEKLSMI